MLSAEILSIGDELLIGQVVNTNASFISQQLNAIGIEVARVTTIGDEPQRLLSAIERSWKDHTIVIATGGLGPTHDDISKHIVAKYFKKKLLLHPPTLTRVKARFRKFGYKKMPDANISQAMIPEGFSVLNNDRGTAPGLLYHTSSKTFVILPGVPSEMKWLLENQVLPRLKKIHQQQLGQVIVHKTLLTTGVGESLLAEKIGEISNILEQGATLAFLPKLGGVRLRITVKSPDAKTAKQIIKRIETKIRKKVGTAIYGVNDDTLERAVVELLKQQHSTLSVAESCTGGMLAMRLTSVAGLSQNFPGGIVSYANEIKKLEYGVPQPLLKAHGAVSEQCAIAMAEGIRKKFRTDYALSITGIAGPDGGSREKPVGTVWIALAQKGKATLTKLSHFAGDREDIRIRSTETALELLRRRLLLQTD